MRASLARWITCQGDRACHQRMSAAKPLTVCPSQQQLTLVRAIRANFPVMRHLWKRMAVQMQATPFAPGL
jgi:hypothetical protein